MKQEIDSPTVTPTTDCCTDPDYTDPDNIDLTPKLHQSRGYIDYTCASCGHHTRVDYYLSHKEFDGQRLDKDAMSLPGDCRHGRFDQTAILAGAELRVESICGKCGAVVWDIFKQF